MTEKNSKLSEWKVVKEEDVVKSRFLRLKNVTFQLPNNEIVSNYFIAEKGSVAVVIFLNDNKTYLMSEWERGVGEIGHKLPSGMIESGENILEGTIREIKEELGVVSSSLEFLGETYIVPGFMKDRAFYFLCRDFTQESEYMVDDPFELFVGEWIDFDKLGEMIGKNEVKNPFVIVGYFLAKSFLEKNR